MQSDGLRAGQASLNAGPAHRTAADVGNHRLRYRAPTWVVLAAMGMLAGSAAASSPQGGGYRIDWSSLDGGGELISNDPISGLEIGGTMGQPDAGQSDGGNALIGSGYALYSGYWSIVLEDDRIFASDFETP